MTKRYEKVWTTDELAIFLGQHVLHLNEFRPDGNFKSLLTWPESADEPQEFKIVVTEDESERIG